MHLNGDLSDFALADILQILSLGRKTGTLLVENGSLKGRIVIEAGRITGASWSATVRRILLPLLRPRLLVAFLLVFIPSFSELSATILLYTGGTETIAIAIYRLNDLGQLEVVSALAVFTIAVVLALTALVNWLSGSSWAAADAPVPVPAPGGR